MEPVLLAQNKIARVGVACIVIRYVPDVSDVEVLMLRRAGSHGPGTWSVPGGWLEYGEASFQAALREVREETGLEAAYIRPAGYTEDFFPEAGKHCVTLWHRAIVKTDAEPRFTEPDKVTAFQWVAPQGPYPEPLFLPLANFLAQGNSL